MIASTDNQVKFVCQGHSPTSSKNSLINNLMLSVQTQDITHKYRHVVSYIGIRILYLSCPFYGEYGKSVHDSTLTMHKLMFFLYYDG